MNITVIKNLIEKEKYNEAYKLLLDLPTNEETILDKIKVARKLKKYDEAFSLCALMSSPDITLEQIKILDTLGRDKEAYSLCRKFNTDKIFSYHIKMLIKRNQLEEALDSIKSSVYQNDTFILSQEIFILTKLNRIKDALELCDRDVPCNKERLMSQKIKLLIRTNNLTEAKRICEMEEYKDNVVIQSQYVYLLLSEIKGNKKMSKHDFEKIEKICSNPNFVNDEVMAETYINTLLRANKFDKALEVANNNCFAKNKNILTKKMEILLFMKNYKDAFDLYDNSIINGTEKAVEILIAGLKKNKEYNKAYILASNPKYENNTKIQLSLVELLIIKGLRDKALEICEKPNFRYNKYFDNLRQQIIRMNLQENVKLGQLIVDVYMDNISYDELKNLEGLDNSTRSILLLAMTEKNNKKNALIMYKNLIKDAEFDPGYQNKLSVLYTQLTNTKKKFDIGIYSRCLRTPFDNKYYKELLANRKEKQILEEKQKEELIKTEIKKEVVKKEEPKLKVVNKNKPIKTVYISSTVTPTPAKRKNINKVKTLAEEKKIKDIYSKECEIILTEIIREYRKGERTKEVVQALDNYYLLINNPISNIDKVNRVIDLSNSLSGEQTKRRIK